MCETLASCFATSKPHDHASDASELGSLELRFPASTSLIYSFQTSTNPVDWVDLSTKTPFNGVFRFVDAGAIDMIFRCYRAVSP